jgi:hypothetical protein
MRPTSALLAALVIAAAACSDRTPTPGGTDPAGSGNESAAAASALVVGNQPRMERLARRVAVAMADPAFRSRVRAELAASPFREHKVQFQRLLAASNGSFRRELARLNHEADSVVDAEARGTRPLEMYFPVAAQRSAWTGDTNVLVATAEQDHEQPVAFDVRGRRRLLSADAPPPTPVLAIEPVETDFDHAPPAAAVCNVDDCKPGPGQYLPPAPGLYLTYAHFTSTFEGWLKGDPEFEIHILGQQGTTDSLTSYQCAGEKAGMPYYFDQNQLDWTGSVMLFSQAQLDGYRAAHPSQNFRIVVWEDDDTACGIRTDADRFKQFENQLVVAYNTIVGAKDTVSGLTRIVKGASSIFSLISKAYSLITTQDDLVGNAIQDDITGEQHPGANWTVKGENNVTNGWLKLEMK